jgi:hypothetical protein
MGEAVFGLVVVGGTMAGPVAGLIVTGTIVAGLIVVGEAVGPNTPRASRARSQFLMLSVWAVCC